MYNVECSTYKYTVTVVSEVVWADKLFGVRGQKVVVVNPLCAHQVSEPLLD